MTTVSQMIEWMKTLPQDAEVECGVEVTSGYDTYMTYNSVKVEYCDVFDYTSEEDRKRYSNVGGKVIVRICGE
jgi:hypothetical protein